MAEDMMSFYTGNRPGGVPGLLPKPYYWWEAGALMGSLVDYWYYTGDTRWNDVAEEGLLFQVGPNNDYMPPNQTMTEGNDDQGFWGMAVMSAAENRFQDPPHGKPQWLALAQAVFNTQAARWEKQDCGGGLRWQIFRWNNGYNYKNSISQACFFNIAARLARYTGNQSYAEWAERTWDWMAATELLDPKTYHIYDGMHVENCSKITPYQWTYNAGAFLLGAGAMYNYSAAENATQAETWRERVDGLLNGTAVFFTGDDKNIMTEVACEPVDLCDLDQQSFKAYLARWMAATTKWAPWTYDRIKPLLESSAMAATATCTGGGNGRMCGLKWNTRKWDGSTGVGQQMAAMEVVLANTIERARAPVTDWDGGTSVGDPAAGGADVGRKNQVLPPISTAEKAGAYILTVLVILGLITGSVFVLLDENDPSSLSERFAKLCSAVAVAGHWSRQPNEKAVDRSDSDETQGDMLENGKGLVLHSCNSPHPKPRVGEHTILVQTYDMGSLALAALSVPVSAWGLGCAYSWLIVDNTHVSISSYIFLVVLAALALRTSLSLFNRYRFECRARALGCGPVALYPHKDPVLGLDGFVEGLRALNSHTLLHLYSNRFASYGNTHYAIALGRWLLMTNEVENIKAILGTKMDDWPIDGPRLLSTLPVLGPDSIFTSNGEAWHRARAMVRPSFVRDQVADLKCFDRHIKSMLAALPDDGTTFDIQSLLLDMTMDSSTDFLLGYSTNLLTKASPEGQQFVRDFEYASRESAKLARLGPILYHLPHRQLKKVVGQLREYVRFYLKRAIAAKDDAGARDRSYVFLDELLKANPPEDYTIDQILSILIGGRDTTAAALTSTFYFLARNPAAVEKLREEINSVKEETPTWEQLKHMIYLNSVIKEALRLFSPVATNSRTSNKETVLPRGGGKDGRQPVLVPKGMSVRWSSHVLHRNTAVFGPDADEFRPERWDSDLRVSWEYIPFSGGPRICVGQQFALTQIAYTLFKFFREFRAIEARDSD
ncbi:mannan endo-1 6-alpha-mannosidase DCW1 [Chaetomidium leptoderma]|uniref:mannan endo-1,6-alpha-mannosidase n=1 Tax=Chaetomidium leptoderma TaxID=669021 RepID=A0AAN6VQQ5_9PEZI|nr:mannan endo-1 6-alpha-mannosidase DCW1 [Chaetomidium leptoderma]